MLKKDDFTVIDIVDLNADGFGVGRVNDFVLFVNGGLPGDKLEVKFIENKKSYGIAEIVKVLLPSTHRVKPRCPATNRCGGCQWQHCDYQTQLLFKKKIVIDALTRIGGIKEPPVKDVVGMENPWSYRNKAAFQTSTESGMFTIGMYEPQSHRIVEVDKCAIQHPAHILIIKTLREFGSLLNIRRVVIRVGFSTSDVMVNIETDKPDDSLIKALKSAGATTILLNKKLVFGPGYIREQLADIFYHISASSFFQVNPLQTKVLFDIALNQALPKNSEEFSFVDAHCGVGSIALYAAKKARYGIGVDSEPNAIKDAKKNAALNGIKNIKFLRNTAEAALPELLDKKPHTVFLDPPRKGCGSELISALITNTPKNIVYISCEAATLARDIKKLTKGGYNLIDVRPVDMFPMTGKTEVSCLLSI